MKNLLVQDTFCPSLAEKVTDAEISHVIYESFTLRNIMNIVLDPISCFSGRSVSL